MSALLRLSASLRFWWVVLLLLLPCAAENAGPHAQATGRHLFLLSGQSNMTGSLEAGFRAVVQREMGEDKVAVVRHNKPGRGIRFWVADYELPASHPLSGKLQAGNGEEFPKLVAAARSAGDPKAFASVTLVWMQGESDANRDLAAAYGKSFRTLLDRLKTELGISTLHFVIGRISDHGLHGEQAEGWKSMRKVQQELAEADPLGAWIDTDDLNGGDETHPQGELHYPAAQYAPLGARFAEAAIRQRRATTAATDKPAGNVAKRPNIVLILSDDMGYENLSCYGSKVYQTPNIDALAASGMRFLHAHAQPICTPSRVQLMTGIYNNRNYRRFGFLDPQQVTFANLLRDAGYATAIGGKWQLEGDYGGVKNFGFDRHCLWQLNRRPSRYTNPRLEIDGERKDYKKGEFGPDIVNAYLRDFIRSSQDKEQPFFVYYPMMLPHWPFVPTPDHPDYDPKLWLDADEEPRGQFMTQKYWDAFVRYTDKMVGQLVATLEETGQRENTLILWTADNGTHYGIVSEYLGRPYRGGKGSTTDNGTHVGFIASWPGVIKPGVTSDALVDFSDVLPTLTTVAGIATPQNLDGVSLLPVLQGKPEARNKDAIYCWYEPNGKRTKATQHTRDQRHKLYATGTFYDTIADPEEKTDLAANGVPADLAATHAKLKAVLDRQLAITAQADKALPKPENKARKK